MRWMMVAAALCAVARGAGAAPAVASGFRVVDVASGLSQPTALAFAPDGRLFIAEKTGAVRWWNRRGGLRGTPLLTLPSCTAKEMGVLGLAVDPDFATNRFLYVYHTHPPGGDTAQCGTATGRENRVVRVTVGDEIATDLTPLLGGLRTDNGNHDGGGLRFGPDGFLYVAVGDTGVGDFGGPGQSTNPYAQDRHRLEGKILRITRDGAPAPGNPFAGEGDNAAYVFAYGLRNPFRFAFEPATGLLWAGDVGQNTWEEIDVIRAGDNLGWPQCEGLEPLGTCPGGTTPPVYVYDHDGGEASVTGGVFYDGALFGDGFIGNYFFADYVTDQIWRALPTHNPEGFSAAPTVFVGSAGRAVDFAVGPDGALYYAAFGVGGIRKLVPASQAGPECVRSLGARTPGWALGVAKASRRCLGSPQAPACFPPADYAAALSARTLRRLDRACDRTPAPDLCSALACGRCVTVADLAGCLGNAVTSRVATLSGDVIDADTGVCGRTVVRVAARTMAGRLAARQRCRTRLSIECDLPALGTPLARKVARACNDPSATVCTALACSPCGNGAALADCVSDRTVALVDQLSQALDGGF